MLIRFAQPHSDNFLTPLRGGILVLYSIVFAFIFLISCSCPAKSQSQNATLTLEDIATRHLDAALKQSFFDYDATVSVKCDGKQSSSLFATGEIDLGDWSHYSSDIGNENGGHQEIAVEYYVRSGFPYRNVTLISPAPPAAASTLPGWSEAVPAQFRAEIPFAPEHVVAQFIDNQLLLAREAGEHNSGGRACDQYFTRWDTGEVSAGNIDICIDVNTGLVLEMKITDTVAGGGSCISEAVAHLKPRGVAPAFNVPKKAIDLYSREAAKEKGPDAQPGKCEGPPAPSNIEQFTTDNGLPADGVIALLAAGNSVWAGTSKGVEQYNSGLWTLHTAGGKMNGLSVGALAKTADGLLWAATNAGLFSYDGSKWNLTTKEQGLPDNMITCLETSLDRKTLWAGSPAGLGRLSGGKWQTFTTDNGLPSNTINGLHTADDGSMWIVTPKGLSLFVNRVFHNDSSSDSAPAGQTIDTVTTDKDGLLWAILSPYGGLAFYDGQKWRMQTAASGFPSSKTTSIFSDANGCIMATADGVLVRFDGRHWSQWRPTQNPPSALSSPALAPDGSVWLATDRGLIHLTF